MIAYALVLAALAASWAHAELRRLAAERECEAQRAAAVQLLLRLDDLTGRADRLLRAHHAAVPQWQALHGPGASELQEAASAVDRACAVAREGVRLLDRRRENGSLTQ